MKSALGMLRKLEPRKKGIRDYSKEPVQQTGVNRRKYISFESVFGQEAVWRKEMEWHRMQEEKRVQAAIAEMFEAHNQTEAEIVEAQKQEAEANRQLQEILEVRNHAILAFFEQGFPLQNIAHIFQKTPEEIEQIINEQGLDS